MKKQMLFKGHHDSPPGYAEYKFDMLAAIITDTQLHGNRIKTEYKKLAKFYKANPEIFFGSLNNTKEVLEEKLMYEPLTEFETMSLNEINNIMTNKMEIKDLFGFEELFYLDDFRKVFGQIIKKNVNILLTQPIVDIVYYGIEVNPEFNDVAIGEKFSNGLFQTGSKLILKILRVDHEEMITKYQTLFN